MLSLDGKIFYDRVSYARTELPQEALELTMLDKTTPNARSQTVEHWYVTWRRQNYQP